MERVLEIEKFRNIGLEKKEKIIINKSLEKGKIGDLIILIGANNSGKSNVLDALQAFGTNGIKERDVTTLSYKDEDRRPSLALVTKDGQDIYSYKKIYGMSNPIIELPSKKLDKKIASQNAELMLNVLSNLTKNSYVSLYDCSELKSQFNNAKTLENYEQILLGLESLIEKYYSAYNRNHYYRSIWETLVKEIGDKSRVISEIKHGSALKKDKDKLDNIFNTKYKIASIPQIINYQENPITSSKLNTDWSSFVNNSFFTTVLNSIGVNYKEILNVYQEFQKYNNKGVLSTLAESLNKKLKAISKKFNDLYFLEEDSYKFKLDFESTKIYFNIFRDGTSITLDHQSTGFKWFFNLYFNILCGQSLNPGDILIMDEPATNLHVLGQEELRKFLKEFAIKNDITIILATHSPFLIDLDYLDEIRVISMENNKAQIDNDFATINIDDADSLLSVKNALTVSNHILLDPDVKVVFVEGITDYNYMVAFKKLLKRDDIVFLPIRGVGKYGSEGFKDKQLAISKRLIQIKKHGPILMVDSDGAGKSMKNTNKDSELNVFALADVDVAFRDIETLFDETDLKKLEILNSKGEIEKHSMASAIFKTHIAPEFKFSKNTLRNFEKLFKYIDNL